MLRFFLAVALTGFLAPPVLAQYGDSANTSGGPLKPEQAAFDVTFYDLSLAFVPEFRSIRGMLRMEARIVAPTSVIVLDLDQSLLVDVVRRRKIGSILQPGTISHSAFTNVPFEHQGGTVSIRLGRTYQPGEELELRITYGGQPIEAARPPWDGGFTWTETEDGQPWIAVSCQGEGADLWWPDSAYKRSGRERPIYASASMPRQGAHCDQRSVVPRA
ncbi:MAG: hypothetical protein IIC18_06690 [Bacteroidetes bacterium]|nr:hypothetical protein [Bacteroidota bacterium]